MRVTLRGVYKFFFDAMMTPERYAKRAHLLFSRYYDRGTLSKEVVSPTEHVTIIRDWPAHHPFLCEIMAYMAEYVYDALGCRGLTVARTHCVDSGDPDCRFVSRWASYSKKNR
jgi:hypothetical protein